MSWQGYVDDNLLKSPGVSEAAIWGVAGGQWAASPGFKLSDSEHATIIAGFKTPSNFAASGLTIAGVKYMFLKSLDDDNTILAKKGEVGVVVAKTVQAILIAVAKSPNRIEDASVAVGKLAEYLRGVGY